MNLRGEDFVNEMSDSSHLGEGYAFNSKQPEYVDLSQIPLYDMPDCHEHGIPIVHIRKRRKLRYAILRHLEN